MSWRPPKHITSDSSMGGHFVCLHCGVRQRESIFGTGADIAMKKFARAHADCPKPEPEAEELPHE